MRSSRIAGGCACADGGERAVGAGQAQYEIFAAAAISPDARHHRRPIGRTSLTRAPPTWPARHVRGHDDARPGTMRLALAVRLWRCGHRTDPLILASAPRSGTRPRARGQIEAGRQHQAEMREHRHVGSLDGTLPSGLAERDPVQAQEQCPEATSNPNTSRSASSGWRANVELTIRNSLMKMPIGGRPAIATTPSTDPSRAPGGSR